MDRINHTRNMSQHSQIQEAVHADFDPNALFKTEPNYLKVDQGALAYRKVGRGPDVLFVHGWPVTSATFRKLLPRLAPHVTCHLVDLLGVGDSRFERSTPLNLAHHIQTIREAVDPLALHDFSVVGHDSGGLIARHAFASDSRVRSMVLINTEQPQGLSAPFRRFLRMAKLPFFELALGWAVMRRWLRRSSLLLGECFVDRARLDGEFERYFLEPLNRDRKRRWAAAELARNFDLSFVHGLHDVHKQIAAPVKLVWGEDDVFFPVERAREMLNAFPDATLHVVKGGKLFCHEEQADEVADAMLPTLLA